MMVYWFVEDKAVGRYLYFFFQAEDGIRDIGVTGVQTCALPICGPAWTRTPDGQWYLHLFTPQQPDLNWDNPEVRDDFRTTLRFWSDRGADGFRVDVAHGLAKDLTGPLVALAHDAHTALPDGSHPLWDRDEVHEIYSEWRRVFNEYDPPRTAVAEAWVHPSRRHRYASPEGLGQAFNFDLLEADWNPDDFRHVIR